MSLVDRCLTVEAASHGRVAVLDRLGAVLVTLEPEKGLDSEALLLAALLAGIRISDPINRVGIYSVGSPHLQLGTATWDALFAARCLYGWEPTVTQAELADLLGITRQAVNQRIEHGSLPAVHKCLKRVVPVNRLDSPLREQALAFLAQKRKEQS